MNMSIKLQQVASQCDYFVPIVGSYLSDSVPSLLKKEDVKIQQGKDSTKKIPQVSPKIKKQLAYKLKKICSKYMLNPDEDEMEILINKALLVRQFSTGGSRELIAVVVFCQYSDKIQLSIKEFCNNNSLSTKVFNKKYKNYYQIFPYHNRATRSDDQNTKNQEKSENSDIEQGFKLSQTFLTPQQTIDLIYDSIFTSHYFQTHRRQIIEKIADSYQKMDRTKFDAMDWIESESSKMLYALYGILKEYGAHVSFYDFRMAVFNATNIWLRFKSAVLVQSLFKQKHKQEDIYEPEYFYQGPQDNFTFGVLDEEQDFFMA